LSSIRPPIATLQGAARDLVIGEITYDRKTITLLDVGKLMALVKI
jgi:chemotaxis signal transduction protein